MSPQQQKSDNHLRSVNSEASVPTLIRQLADDATNMFTHEIQLAKTEISENLNSAKKGLASTATGALVLYAGALTLIFSAVLGLANVVDLWLSALIVGGVVTLIGFFMLGAGKKKMSSASLRPDHTINSIKDDKKATKGAVS